jgi:hypothetical protein
MSVKQPLSYSSMPTGFFIWRYMYPFTFIFGGTSKFLGVQSLTLHLGVQRKLTNLTGYIQYYKQNGGTDTKAMGQTEPHFLSDPMSDRKKEFLPTLRNIYKNSMVHVHPNFWGCNL